MVPGALYMCVLNYRPGTNNKNIHKNWRVIAGFTGYSGFWANNLYLCIIQMLRSKRGSMDNGYVMNAK